VEKDKTVSVADLGIPPRDAGLFTSDNSHATNQRAAIMVRNDKILFKTEAVRAVISEARAVLIRNKPGKSFETTLKVLQEAIDGEEEDSVPFELNMLEALLFLTSSYFDVRIGHLNFMYDGVVADMRESSEPFSAVASEAMLQQLTPLDKAITAVRSDARETREAISDVLNNEDVLQSVCLSQMREAAASTSQSPEAGLDSSDSQHARSCIEGAQEQQDHKHVCNHRNTHDKHNQLPNELKLHEQSDVEQVRRMLATYEREMNSVMGQLEEMRENLDGTREACGMRMDAARNEIILLNLKMTLASLCLMICVVMPTMLGMNVSHGMPDQPWVFYSVCGASVMIAALCYPLASYMFRRSWRAKSASEVARFTSLRLFLMQHLDDLDDIRASLESIRGQVDRAQFKQHLRSSLPGTKFSAGALDCLFDQYDVDRDGLVREVEINQRNVRQDITSITAGMPEEVKRDLNSSSYFLERAEVCFMYTPSVDVDNCTSLMIHSPCLPCCRK